MWDDRPEVNVHALVKVAGRTQGLSVPGFCRPADEMRDDVIGVKVFADADTAEFAASFSPAVKFDPLSGIEGPLRIRP